MPSEYVLKRSPVSPNKIRKYAKDIIDECADDRRLALDLYHKLKEEYEKTPSVEKQRLMVQVLKLAQTSKDSGIKLLDTLVKLEAAVNSSGPGAEENARTIDFTELNKAVGNNEKKGT